MSPNRAERRRIDRQVKKLQRKEEKKVMKMTDNSCQYNAKKSNQKHLLQQNEKSTNQQEVIKRIHPPKMSTNPSPPSPPGQISSTTTAVVETTIIKIYYAICMGYVVSKTFKKKRLLADRAYQAIEELMETANFRRAHARGTALRIDDNITSDLDDMIEKTLIATDFDAILFANTISNILLNIVTEAVMDILGDYIDDKEYLHDVFANSIFDGIYKIISKAVYRAMKIVAYKAVEDHYFYQEIVEECDMYNDDFFDEFFDDYYTYYNNEVILTTPETTSSSSEISEDDDYELYYYDNDDIDKDYTDDSDELLYSRDEYNSDDEDEDDYTGEDVVAKQVRKQVEEDEIYAAIQALYGIGISSNDKQ